MAEVGYPITADEGNPLAPRAYDLLHHLQQDV